MKNSLDYYLDAFEVKTLILVIGDQRPIRINFKKSGSYTLVWAFNKTMKFSFVSYLEDTKVLKLEY